jgi:hypothetical protein
MLPSSSEHVQILWTRRQNVLPEGPQTLPDYTVSRPRRHYLKMKAERSCETSTNITGLHGVSSQKTLTLFSHSLPSLHSWLLHLGVICHKDDPQFNSRPICNLWRIEQYSMQPYICFTLKIEAGGSSEMSITFYYSTRHRHLRTGFSIQHNCALSISVSAWRVNGLSKFHSYLYACRSQQQRELRCAMASTILAPNAYVLCTSYQVFRFWVPADGTPGTTLLRRAVPHVNHADLHFSYWRFCLFLSLTITMLLFVLYILFLGWGQNESIWYVGH